MIESEKTHQNLSEYIQLLSNKKFEVNNKSIFSGEKMAYLGNSVSNISLTPCEGVLIHFNVHLNLQRFKFVKVLVLKCSVIPLFILQFPRHTFFQENISMASFFQKLEIFLKNQKFYRCS